MIWRAHCGEEYQVETEMADLRNVVAVVTFANEEQEVKQLIEALQDISRRRDRRFLCKNRQERKCGCDPPDFSSAGGTHAAAGIFC